MVFRFQIVFCVQCGFVNVTADCSTHNLFVGTCLRKYLQTLPAHV